MNPQQVERAGRITKKLIAARKVPDLKTIQKSLERYFKPNNNTFKNGEPDGRWGGETAKAVVALQRDLIGAGELEQTNSRGRSNVDGIYGPGTKRAADAFNQESASAAASLDSAAAGPEAAGAIKPVMAAADASIKKMDALLGKAVEKKKAANPTKTKYANAKLSSGAQKERADIDKMLQKEAERMAKELNADPMMRAANQPKVTPEQTLQYLKMAAGEGFINAVANAAAKGKIEISAGFGKLKKDAILLQKQLKAKQALMASLRKKAEAQAAAFANDPMMKAAGQKPPTVEQVLDLMVKQLGEDTINSMAAFSVSGPGLAKKATAAASSAFKRIEKQLKAVEDIGSELEATAKEMADKINSDPMYKATNQSTVTPEQVLAYIKQKGFSEEDIKKMAVGRVAADMARQQMKESRANSYLTRIINEELDKVLRK